MLASILGGVASGIGSIFAGNAQKRAADRDLRFKKQVYNEGVERTQPWVDAGQNALAQYMQGFNGGGQQVLGNFYQSPEYLATYNSLMDRAQEGVERRGAATGTLNSGRTAMALQDRAGDIGSMQINNYLSRLGGMSNTGLGAASGVNSFANTSAQGIGQANYNQGNALASTYLGVGNSINNTLSDIVQQGGQAFGAGRGSTSAFGGF
jgi:hypothetical protein